MSRPEPGDEHSGTARNPDTRLTWDVMGESGYYSVELFPARDRRCVMTPVRPRPAVVTGARRRIPCAGEAGSAALPAQRAIRHVVLPPEQQSTWEGYSNAGPDVYWTPAGEDIALS